MFIVLPTGADGDAILGYICEEMPGLVVEPWSFEPDGPQERVPRGAYHKALIAFMAGRLPVRRR